MTGDGVQERREAPGRLLVRTEPPFVRRRVLLTCVRVVVLAWLLVALLAFAAELVGHGPSGARVPEAVMALTLAVWATLYVLGWWPGRWLGYALVALCLGSLVAALA